MRNCNLFLNAGRNTLGIFEDVKKWLGDRGWTPATITVICYREGDDTLSQMTECKFEWVDSGGNRISEFIPIGNDYPDVSVVNGGTTPQMWWHSEKYAYERCENLTTEIGEGHPRPYLASVYLDVQRDAVTVLSWTDTNFTYREGDPR